MKSSEDHGPISSWMPFIRIHEVHASSGVYVSGFGAKNIGMANTQREKKPAVDELNDLFENTNTKKRKQKREKEILGPLYSSRKAYFNTTWEVGE